MADTGSEIADSATRNATGIISRILERELMMRITKHDGDAARTSDSPEETPADIEIGVRCPKGDLDARAEEILEALERGNVRATCTIDDASSTITLAISPGQGEATLRALERLSASRRSGFSIDDVTGIDQLETIAGRRAIGSNRNADAKQNNAQRMQEPVESVALTFANQPEEPKVDAQQAEAYAQRMASFGFDTSHRPIDRVQRDPNGRLTRTPTHVVGVSYLVSERDNFVTASGVALHEIGAMGKDDPFAANHDAYVAAKSELEASAEARRASFQRNRETTANEPQRTSAQEAAPSVERKPVTQPSHDDTTHDDDLTAEEYHALPPREQSKVDPSRIPDAAFGTYRASEVAREQTAAASAMAERATPDRSHPSIGGR